ncbi:MAG: M67 family metallopeptidase [Thiotrichaceae bacterium]|nr:M67 family metallopeptidase [Thiotrichaceae bacterium]PCI11308.1 MAG: hypothetical protein COB71_11555 [Thiotrichales bacterium]
MTHNKTEQISLPRTLINQLLTHAQSGNGDEVCGFIASVSGEPIKTYPVPNIATPANKRFEMEPSAQIDAIKIMREQDEEIFAIYHSHPTSAAAPSQTDIAEFNYPGALCVIISLNIQGVLEIRAYRIIKNQVFEASIEAT